VRCRDPALIVSLRAGSDSRAISTNDSDLIGRVDLLGTLGRPLRALSTLAATLLLGEEGGDPGVVDKVRNSTEHAQDDEIQEDAIYVSVQECGTGAVWMRRLTARVGTYIWGSKKLVAASTTVTVSL
jgi:hypothetical protein